jgi:hypothetical protein
MNDTLDNGFDPQCPCPCRQPCVCLAVRLPTLYPQQPARCKVTSAQLSHGREVFFNSELQRIAEDAAKGVGPFWLKQGVSLAWG